MAAIIIFIIITPVSFYAGYLYGKMQRRREFFDLCNETSRLASESVRREIELTKLQLLIQSAIEQNAQEKA